MNELKAMKRTPLHALRDLNRELVDDVGALSGDRLVEVIALARRHHLVDAIGELAAALTPERLEELLRALLYSDVIDHEIVGTVLGSAGRASPMGRLATACMHDAVRLADGKPWHITYGIEGAVFGQTEYMISHLGGVVFNVTAVTPVTPHLGLCTICAREWKITKVLPPSPQLSLFE